MSTFSKVRRGQEFIYGAELHNAFVDAAEAHAANKLPTSPGQISRFGQRGIFPVRNDSGVDLDRFNVLGIDTIIALPANLVDFKNEINFVGSTPTNGQHYSKFCVVLESIKDGKFGLACFSGICHVLVNGVTDEDYSADIRDGSRVTLEPKDNGAAQILFSDPATDWCIVRLSNGASQLIDGQITSIMNQGDTVSMNIDSDDGGGTQLVRDIGSKILSGTVLSIDNDVTATRGNPGRLISFDCNEVE